MNEILKERFFKLEQELELADAEIAKLKAENAQLRESALLSHKTRDEVVKGAGKVLEEYATLKAENARLAAALNKAKVAYDRLYSFHGTPTPPPNLTCDQKQCDWCEVGEALDEPSTVLRDLLAPTLSCLKTIAQSNTGINAGLAHVELQRLRALCGEGKQVDK